MKFRIEYISNGLPSVMLIARQMNDGKFALPVAPKLGGIPIRRTLDQPRSLKPDGTPDLSVWVFTLASVRDAGSFEVGQITELGS